MSEIHTIPIALSILLLLAIAEWTYVRLVRRQAYTLSATAASIGIAVGQSALKPLALALIVPVYAAAYALAPLRLPIDDWRVWVLGFFAMEFSYYWFHRCSHRINWLWATHAVHHSATELTLPAAIRLGWTGPISGGWLFYVPLILCGFSPAMVTALLTINLLYQYGLHTEVIDRLGPLEWVLNTPSHHRAHHSSEGPWLDCNFGGVLIIFDRLFGTFVPEPDGGGLRYGLTRPLTSHNPFRIAFHQWGIMAAALIQARRWADVVTILFGSPAELDHLVTEQDRQFDLDRYSNAS
jgi:sterol desaturase/sphingolipid hydroxylase (fatty acid hydroxylase superfamily)